MNRAESVKERVHTAYLEKYGSRRGTLLQEISSKFWAKNALFGMAQICKSTWATKGYGSCENFYTRPKLNK
jgi:hypothetical protein